MASQVYGYHEDVNFFIVTGGAGEGTVYSRQDHLMTFLTRLMALVCVMLEIIKLSQNRIITIDYQEPTTLGSLILCAKHSVIGARQRRRNTVPVQ